MALSAIIAVPSKSKDAEIHIAPTPVSNVSASGLGISDDHSVMLADGINNNTRFGVAFLFSPQNGESELLDESKGMPSTDDFMILPAALSGDGTTIVGSFRHRNTSGFQTEAFKWTRASGAITLGQLPGDLRSVGEDVTRDGSMVVGISFRRSEQQAVFWDSNNDIHGLGFLPDPSGEFVQQRSRAFGVNADGSVIVGSATNVVSGVGGTAIAVRWVNGVIEELGRLEDGRPTLAFDVSDDGSIIIGDGFMSGVQTAAFRWENGTMTSLPYLPGDNEVRAFAISGNGKVIVGSGRGDGDFNSTAVLWLDRGTRILTVTQWMQDNGVNVGDLNLDRAMAVSPDGNVIVGATHSGEAFLATIGGLVTPSTLNLSLFVLGQGLDLTSNSIHMMLHGAHSQPLSRRVGKGRFTAWTAGDLGRDDHGHHDGSLGLAELGGGYNFGLLQLNISAGQTWANQDLPLNGRIESDGQYINTALSIPLADRFGAYLNVSAFSHWGDLTVKRGYMNAGNLDASRGETNTIIWGARARVDMYGQLGIGGPVLNPYLDISYVDNHMDGYTETGGGFPIKVDERDHNVAEFHGGTNAALPLGNTKSRPRLLLNLEVAHRSKDEGPRSSGQIIGLFAFNQAGQKYKRTWLKGGIGMDAILGAGRASLMLHGTTKGEMANLWAAMSYQLVF